MYSEKLATVIDAVQDIKLALKTYCLCSDKLPVSIKDLRYAIEHARNLKIKRLFFKSESKILKGMMRHFGDTVEILIRSDLDKYTSRFVFVKEVGHVVLMDANNITAKPDALLEQLILDKKFIGASTQTPDVEAEALALMVAIELLFPYEDRVHDRSRLDAGETSISELATHYELPEDIIELGVSESYADLASKLWRAEDAA